jgi:hypothetical protein
VQKRGHPWEYEPESFQLTETMSYTPDFLVEGTYYEIKGRMSDHDRLQINTFRENYPERTLVVIDGEKYDALRVQYKQRIPSWEGK